MKTIESIIRMAGRFVFGLGIGFAIVCTVVIVSTRPVLQPEAPPRSQDAVRLDPVVVTLSRERYDAIRREAHDLAVLARSFDRRRNEV